MNVSGLVSVDGTTSIESFSTDKDTNGEASIDDFVSTHQTLNTIDSNRTPLLSLSYFYSQTGSTGHQSFVEFRDKKSKRRRVKQGVPQDGIEIVSYADDCTIMSSGPPSIDDICDRLNVYLKELASYFAARNLKICATKSSATLFTTNTREVNTELTVMVDGEMNPTIKCPKILDVTFDSSGIFFPHATAICDKIKGRNEVLKKLAGSRWGADKETLLTTYKAIGRSVISYAAPV
uniref:Reverse transcriptase domain-containing protein n=1 Tax=Stomoxys calcitrans TaxID=35570 RepID=A0A1I8NS53_STOCA